MVALERFRKRDLRCHFAPSAYGEVDVVHGAGSEVDAAPWADNEVGAAPGVCSEVEAVPFTDGGSDA